MSLALADGFASASISRSDVCSSQWHACSGPLTLLHLIRERSTWKILEVDLAVFPAPFESHIKSRDERRLEIVREK